MKLEHCARTCEKYRDDSITATPSTKRLKLKNMPQKCILGAGFWSVFDWFFNFNRFVGRVAVISGIPNHKPPLFSGVAKQGGFVVTKTSDWNSCEIWAEMAHKQKSYSHKGGCTFFRPIFSQNQAKSVTNLAKSVSFRMDSPLFLGALQFIFKY